MEEEKGEKEAIPGIPSLGLPAEVWMNDELTSTEKLLFGILRNLSQSSRGCWASNRYLANIIGIKHPQTLSSMVMKLRAEGYLIIKYLDIKRRGRVEQERRIYVDNGYGDRYRKMVQTKHDDYFGEETIDIREKFKSHKVKNLGVSSKSFTKEDSYQGTSKEVYRSAQQTNDLPSDNSSFNEETSSKNNNDSSMKNRVNDKVNNKKPNKPNKPTATSTSNKKDSHVQCIVRCYNKHTTTAKIKIDPKSKTYQRIIKLIDHLLSGQQFQWGLDPQWAKDNRLTDERLNHRFTKQEIIDVIMDMMDLRNPGYEPSASGQKRFCEKASLKDLLLYEPQKRGGFCSSWFLYTWMNGGVPKQQESYTERQWEKFPHKDEAERFFKLAKINGDASLKQSIVKGMEEMMKFRKWLPNDSSIRMGKAGGGILGGYNDYLTMYEGQGWLRGAFNIRGNVFRRWLDDVWDATQLSYEMSDYQTHGLSWWLDKYLAEKSK